MFNKIYFLTKFNASKVDFSLNSKIRREIYPNSKRTNPVHISRYFKTNAERTNEFELKKKG